MFTECSNHEECYMPYLSEDNKNRLFGGKGYRNAGPNVYNLLIQELMYLTFRLTMYNLIRGHVIHCNVLPAKSDRYVILCLQSYQGLRIDRSLVYLSYLQDRINTQVIYRFA